MGNLRGFCAALLAIAGAAVAIAMPTAASAALVVDKWEAGTCVVESCKDSEGPTSPNFYTQAAGHPDFGITDFRFTARKIGLGHEEPEGKVKDARVDLPVGLAVNPEATQAKCTEEQLKEYECPKESQVGIDEATGTVPLFKALGELLHRNIALTAVEKFPVYNMERKPGQPARFGVEVNSETLELLRKLTGHDLRGQIYLEGGLSWQNDEEQTSKNSGVPTGDYHEYFKIENIPEEPELIESKLIFWGIPQEHQKEHKQSPTAFITLPSTCVEQPVTYLHVDSYEAPGDFVKYENQAPVTATGCESLAFDPTLSLSGENTEAGQPDGVSADLHIPQATDEPSKPNSPDVQNVQVTLPEGMTLDPSAANGLQACSDSEYAGGSCPAASQVGSVSVNAPGLPRGALAGGVYVGEPQPGQNSESGGMYRLFLIANSTYGIGLRLEGRVSASAGTGRLAATFSDGPQVPFEDITIHFNGGARAPLANPVGCGPVAPSAAVLPYGGEPTKAAEASGFTVGGCPSPSFSLGQSLTAADPQAGAFSPFTFTLSRGDDEGYPSRLTTTLPAGVVGAIPSVALCDEEQANAGTCSPDSQIGTVTVAAGAGGEPYAFTGKAFLTGPYEGAPYGLSIVVPAVAGPYDLGDVVTRAAISVGLYSGRVVVVATLPTVVGGVPLRLKSLSVDVNRQNFASDPTNCSPLAAETALVSSAGAGDTLSSPFQVEGCGALAFAPKLTASSNAKTSKPDGASLEVKITQPAHQANIRELEMQLPKQLEARFSTIQKSCPAASFETGPPPGACTASSRVGTVSAITPILPGELTGTAWLVSHGAASFPDLDLVLSDGDVKVVIVGHTHIARSSITSVTYEEIPDVPISSVAVDLPVGPSSVLAANGSLCGTSLLAPTTLIAQDGARLTRETTIAVAGCAPSARSRCVSADRRRGAARASRTSRRRRRACRRSAARSRARARQQRRR